MATTLEQRTQALQWEEIADQVAAGDSAATILAALQADPRHKKDIYATSDDAGAVDLLDVLGELGLIGSDRHNNWVGVLPDAVDDSGDALLQAGMGRLYANFKTTNRPIRCYSIPEIGALVSGITATAKTAVPASAEAIQAAMDDLTGGLIWADLTEAEVQAVMDAKAVETAQQAREAIVATALQHFAGITATKQAELNTATEHLNNARASLDELAIAGLTDAELQTRADAVVASSDGNI